MELLLILPVGLLMWFLYYIYVAKYLYALAENLHFKTPKMAFYWIIPGVFPFFVAKLTKVSSKHLNVIMTLAIITLPSTIFDLYASGVGILADVGVVNLGKETVTSVSSKIGMNGETIDVLVSSKEARPNNPNFFTTLFSSLGWVAYGVFFYLMYLLYKQCAVPYKKMLWLFLPVLGFLKAIVDLEEATRSSDKREIRNKEKTVPQTKNAKVNQNDPVDPNYVFQQLPEKEQALVLEIQDSLYLQPQPTFNEIIRQLQRLGYSEYNAKLLALVAIEKK